MSDDDSLVYNAIEIEPIESLFSKIHEARGGEMILIHINSNGKEGPTIHMCSAVDKDDSLIMKLLPKLIESLLDE